MEIHNKQVRLLTYFLNLFQKIYKHRWFFPVSLTNKNTFNIEKSFLYGLIDQLLVCSNSLVQTTIYNSLKLFQFSQTFKSKHFIDSKSRYTLKYTGIQLFSYFFLIYFAQKSTTTFSKGASSLFLVRSSLRLIPCSLSTPTLTKESSRLFK